MKTFLKLTLATAALSTAGLMTIPTAVAGSMESASHATHQPTIVGLAGSNDSFSTLVTAVKAADLVDTLNSDGPFTVFAPTNDAFGKVPADTLSALLQPENKDALTGVLTYHVIAGKIEAADLVHAIQDNGGYAKVKTVNGGKLKAKIMDGDVYLIDANGNKSKITATDLPASNGVVHVIDTVVLPQ